MKKNKKITLTAALLISLLTTPNSTQKIVKTNDTKKEVTSAELNSAIDAAKTKTGTLNFDEKNNTTSAKKTTPKPYSTQKIDDTALNVASKRTITVTNGISDKEKKYKYLFVNYAPDIFTLSVNGKQVNQDKPEAIEIEKNVTITYYAKFQNGRESSIEYIFDVPGSVKEITVSFNWKKEPRIKVKNEAVALVSSKDII